MYFLSQYKKLFLASCISYQEATENAWAFPEKTLMDSEKELKAHIAQMRTDLGLLKTDIEGIPADKVEQFQVKLQTLDTAKIFVATQISSLETLLDKENTFFAGEDFEVWEELWEHYQEIQELQIRFIDYKREYNELVEEMQAVQRTLDTLAQNKLTEVEQKKFQTISNREFLQLSPQERLRFVTLWNFSSADVATGKHKNIEFTFTYDGVFNRDFYIRTTAGQVLPPEVRELTSGTEVFIRSGISGEFFTEGGKRLKIHEGTKVDVSKLATPEELQKMQAELQVQKETFAENPFKDLAEAALDRNIDPKFALIMFGKEIEKSSWTERKVMIEDKITDIARFQDDFADEFPWKKSFEAGKVTEAFAWYLVHILQWDTEALVKEYRFKKENLDAYRKTERYSSGWPLRMENVDIDGTTPEEIQEILKMKKFTPGSREAQILFTVAAQSAGFPESWWTDPKLHYILSKESVGVVGVLNYTIPKSYSTEEFREVSIRRWNNNPIGVRSTASWLGQLVLSNVDIFYPDGRAGIGDALNEAVGMLRYIHDRYGSVDVARSVYGRKASYTHAVTGEHRKKTFKEWY